MALAGGKLAGGNPKEDRVENDYYATNPKAVEMLLLQNNLNIALGKTFLEPCVGGGHIIKGINNYLVANYGVSAEESLQITTLDLVDRGYKNVITQDFLTWETNNKYDLIITNPPYSLAEEFCRKSIDLLNKKGQVAMFLKIQFLEGAKREKFYKEFPPKYIYVFKNRMATWNNGQEFDIDEKTGKKKRWATTMCHAWFVWEQGFSGEPTVRWL